jgi:hypothetical protein
MTFLRRKDESGNWFPTPIWKLENLLNKGIRPVSGYQNAGGLRKNIAYNLQHIQFLDKSLEDLKLTSVLVTQTQKTVIIVGCGVVESLLHYFLTTSGHHSTTEWKLKIIAPGNSKKTDSGVIKIDSHVYIKLPSHKPEQMSFDAMLKKAESKNIMGRDHSIYRKLNHLRPLRNRVHLQEIGHPADTDWHAFNSNDLKLMMQVLFGILAGEKFGLSTEERLYFKYMEKYLDE